MTEVKKQLASITIAILILVQMQQSLQHRLLLITLTLSCFSIFAFLLSGSPVLGGFEYSLFELQSTLASVVIIQLNFTAWIYFSRVLFGESKYLRKFLCYKVISIGLLVLLLIWGKIAAGSVFIVDFIAVLFALMLCCLYRGVEKENSIIIEEGREV